jgi:polyphosphate kinase
MPRNIDHRVEVLSPIRDPSMIRHLLDDVLATYLADKVKARSMQADGSYHKRQPEPGSATISAQEVLLASERGLVGAR